MASKRSATTIIPAFQVDISFDDPFGCSTATESEAEPEIFDSPTPVPSALKLIPSQVRIPATHSALITPPSSCDEVESAIKVVPLKSVGERLPAPLTKSVFKTSADRKASLMIKLVQRYPEYALRNRIDYSGLTASSKIHVFVDSSNVSYFPLVVTFLKLSASP